MDLSTIEPMSDGNMMLEWRVNQELLRICTEIGDTLRQNHEPSQQPIISVQFLESPQLGGSLKQNELQLERVYDSVYHISGNINTINQDISIYFLGPGISQEILPTNLKRFLGIVLYFAKLFMVFMTRGVKQQTIGIFSPHNGIFQLDLTIKHRDLYKLLWPSFNSNKMVL